MVRLRLSPPFKAAVLLILVTFIGPISARAQQTDADRLPSIASFTEGFEQMDGFVPLYWDDHSGRLWMEIASFDQELLYVYSLPAGLGSNDVGLDRGQLGGQQVVFFRRVGPRVLMIQPNYAFRADTDSRAERRSVEDAFAQSVLWGFDISAESGEGVLVDATDFAVRDVHGVVARLKQTGQGDFSLDRNRSALHLPGTKAFPRNTEIEVILTFTSSNPGNWVRDVAPTPDAVTVRERHSFIALPEPGFTVRPAHPGSGYATFFQTHYVDYAAPLGEPMTRRLVPRHRLAKKDPSAAISEPVEPIVYYVDAGVPEPTRSALIDGARWWNEAFEAAGYRNAFRVELLPEDADPMDVRYNVIQWVHRATRGWSYGNAVIDPRTGEILKGHVSLGSLRVRHDYLLAEGLLSPYEEGDERPPVLAEMALARIRQLSAHEVGHTLGLAHNYIASAQGMEGRASVMDYPHPLVILREDGMLDLSQAYADGIGEWDKVAIRYAYEEFAPGVDQKKALEAILRDARAEGLTILSDDDARPAGSAHPLAHLWDLGTNAAEELERAMRVRSSALERFGIASIPAGSPLATLEEVFVPLYLHHRYQIEAAAKILAGRYYTIAIRGDEQEPVRVAPRHEQLAALDALLATLHPEALAVPSRVIELIPPRPPGYPTNRELFARRTGPTFDAIAPAAALSDLTLRMVLQEERAARLIEQHALYPELPGLGEVLSRLSQSVFAPEPTTSYHAELSRTVQRALVERLMVLGASAPAPQVRALASYEIEGIRDRLSEFSATGTESQRAHARLLLSEIGRYFDDPDAFRQRAHEVALPPGSPIGCSE